MTEPIQYPQGERNGRLAGCAAGLFCLLAAQMAMGLLLETRYTPADRAAYASVEAIQRNGLLAMLRAFHYWGSALLIVGSFLTLLWMLFAGWSRGGHAKTWLGTVLLFVCSMGFQITGNLLPFDRHGVETAVVETGVAHQMPVVGKLTSSIILNGSSFGPPTLGRWHLIHISLSALALLAGGLFLAGTVREHKNRAFVWAPIGIAAVLSLMVPAPLGSPATGQDFSTFEATVSWYTWPLHGALTMFSKINPNLGWVGAGLVPGLFLLFLISVPWIGRRVSPRVLEVGFLGFTVFLLAAGVLFGGRFAPLTGNRDPRMTGPGPTVASKTPVNRKLYDEGRKLFNENACEGCHGMDGQHGSEGPDLLHVADRRGRDPQWYINFIQDPRSVKPSTMMPPFPELSSDQRRAIAEFLIHQGG